jgi:HlyD family secretion protein
VRDGDSVATGDKLFTIQSVSLQQDVANGLKIQSSPAYDVDTTMGTLTYRATVAGEVSYLQARLGNSLGTGEPFAKITVTNSQYIDAHYLLSPRDYGRMTKGAKATILLPNNINIAGTVSTIEVATENGQAATQVRVDSPELTKGNLGELTKSGTPVVATIQLRDDGPLAGVSDLAFDFLQQIGLT